jgi:hypothetical protein
MPYPDSDYPSILRGRDKRESQRLLAAAPDLLDACRCAEADLTGLIDTFGLDGEPAEETLAELTAAIAKAEGRE